VGPSGAGRIFVLIPAYRDRDCANTVRNLFARARWPSALSIGILWQLDPEQDAECLAGMPEHPGIRATTRPAHMSRGCSWARHEAMKLWQGEEFALQIDAHTRVVQDWDARMLDQLAACDAARALLTTRPLHFDPPELTADPAYAYTTAEGFDADGY
jgi:hypothetical protein